LHHYAICLQAEMCSDSFQLLGMAQRGFLPAVLARRSQHGTPTLAIILSSVGVMALVRCDARYLCQTLASEKHLLPCTQQAIGLCTADLGQAVMLSAAPLLFVYAFARHTAGVVRLPVDRGAAGALLLNVHEFDMI
jgi:hypothetical protein